MENINDAEHKIQKKIQSINEFYDSLFVTTDESTSIKNQLVILQNEIINPGLKPGAIDVAPLPGYKKETELVGWRGFLNYNKRKLVMGRIISENYNMNTFVYAAKGVYIGEGLFRVYTSYLPLVGDSANSN